jgi:hypothetical protein
MCVCIIEFVVVLFKMLSCNALSVVSATCLFADWQQSNPRERNQVLILQEVGRAPGQVWKGSESLASTAFRFLVRPAVPTELSRSPTFKHKKIYLFIFDWYVLDLT